MSEPIHLGLDLGSLGWRAVCSVGDQLVPLPLPPEWEDPARWLVLQRAPESPLGVTFPSHKEQLGMEPGSPAADVIGGALIALRRLAEQHVGRPPALLVVAVPAMYSAARRAALRDLGLAAGFADVHLINDGMAAVIGHLGPSGESLTALVYSLGYGGHEIALIRVARGRFRAIGYDGGPTPGGAEFDSLIMRDCLDLLIRGRCDPARYDLTPASWLHLRDRVQCSRGIASRSAGVRIDLGLSCLGAALGQRVAAELRRDRYEGEVSRQVDLSLRAAAGLLEGASLHRDGVDKVLLSGGAARTDPVRHAVAGFFGREPAVTTEVALARGAAIYAARLGLLPSADTPAVWPEMSSDSAEPVSDPPAIRVILAGPQTDRATDIQHDLHPASPALGGDGSLPVVRIDVELAEMPRSAPVGHDAAVIAALEDLRRKLFGSLRQLLSTGHPGLALGVLRNIIDEAHDLLAAGPPPELAGAQPEVREYIRRAYDLLGVGRFQHAVEHAHQAYHLAPEDGEVFEQMIEIHCQAAVAHTSADGYKKAIGWLLCAQSHDPTNQTVHEHLAERHFLHARQMAERGRPDEARKALRECLSYDPEHVQAEELLAAIDDRPDTPGPALPGSASEPSPGA